MAYINGKEVFYGVMVTGSTGGSSAEIIDDVLYIRSGVSDPDEPIEPDEPIADGTSGLAYTLSEDGTYYACSGIGTATDTDIVIGSYYNGLPVIEIAQRAFYSNNKITSVTLPDTIKVIRTEAFAFAFNLGDITIPENVISIGYMAFYFLDTNLTACTFKGTPQSIGGSAFASCKNLKNIYVPWSEGAVADAPWGATEATIHYNSEV